MAYVPQPIVEFPNLRVPVALIVDDAVPCINPVWYIRNQVNKQPDPTHERTIPLDFMRIWCDWIQEAGIRGDFTVLPYPAGLGRIDVGLEGVDGEELRDWLDLARRIVAPRFDIHCEILTHTNALDLTTGKMLPDCERDWIAVQDEATLTEYFATAMQILKDADLPNHGLTQPWTYQGDEAMYARAILAAEKRVNGRKVTHNFLHMDSVAPCVPPRITYLDADAGEAVVSVWGATDDYIWQTHESDKAEYVMSPEQLADRYLTADGSGGRLAELIGGGGPVVFVTHWQSLFSNGSALGLRTYQEVVYRMERLWGDRIAWNKLSELSERFLAGRTVHLTTEATRHHVCLTATSPFAADVLTVSIPMPWPLHEAPVVTLDGRVVEPVPRKSDLRSESWLMRGSLVTISITVQRNMAREIVIRPRENKTLL